MTKSNSLSVRELQGLDSIEHIWLLAIGYSMLHYVMAVEFAGRNADAVALFARAFRPSDTRGRHETVSKASADRADISFEESLASDLRHAECQTFGKTMSNLTMPLRKDLILASSVVC